MKKVLIVMLAVAVFALGMSSPGENNAHGGILQRLRQKHPRHHLKKHPSPPPPAPKPQKAN